MPPRKAPSKIAPAKVDAVQHMDKRLNIPTEEQRDFVADAERNPVPIDYERPLLYPRDPDADPQLVWRGKDDQDLLPLTLPAVPLYIQEKIDPRALVEDLRRASAKSAADAQPSMFVDFDGLEGYEKIEFYEHPANWSNRLILGDALVVMNSLAEKEHLRGQVQMIYMDPPYGIKFGSNWQVSTRKRDVKDGADASRQPEQVKAFRDTWKDGIHSYLTYIRDRLILARELLSDSGSLFIQMGDDNVHLLRAVLDEVFGTENFISQIIVRKTTSEGARYVGSTADYVLWYGRDASRTKYRSLFVSRSGAAESRYDQVMESDGAIRPATRGERDDPALLPSGARLFQLGDLTSSRPARDGDLREFEYKDQVFTPGAGTFKTNLEGMKRLGLAGRLQVTSGGTLRYRRFADDFGFAPVGNLWNDISGAVQSRTDPKIYVVQSSTELVQRCLLMSTDPGDLVLDPTCGSGTTAYSAEEWGRRWITVDTSRVALALARTRIMAARYKYYLLEDSVDGAAKEQELTGQPHGRSGYSGDVRQGFVCKRVPHIMLSSITRTDRISSEMSLEQIERTVAQSAEQEILLDQPYVDPLRVRVSGRFTVESLSPHRNLDNDGGVSDGGQESFVTTILENLRTAGVQNTFKGERLEFDSLEPLPSNGSLQASGTMTESDGGVRTVAVAIGPEHGTVSPDMVKDAAREALKGAGFDLLVYCGFAYEAYTTESAKEFAPDTEGFATAQDERQMGRLRVLLARMNPDLAMSEDLLKKTGSGNLFTVFGEPDIAIEKVEDGYTVQVHGVDVYDPTTGQVRSSSTDDIACWFIDTDYDGDQFFVRHAYFTGAGKPYEMLRRALNTDLDHDAWSSLYSTTSRVFARPGTGRIAVKVINHYGDEVLQVYDVA
jgi:adenine-specific DNA-methyltransferase